MEGKCSSEGKQGGADAGNGAGGTNTAPVPVTTLQRDTSHRIPDSGSRNPDTVAHTGAPASKQHVKLVLFVL